MNWNPGVEAGRVKPRRAGKRSHGRERFLLLAGVFFVPFLVFLAGPHSGSGDTEPAELLPISILADHRLDFDRFYGTREDLPYPYRRVGGHVVSAYPIVAGLANLPVYTAARFLGVDLEKSRAGLSHLTAALLAAGSVVFFFLAAESLLDPLSAALLAAAVYAFGTEVWSVASRGAWQHAPSLFFLCASLWLLSSGASSREPRRTTLRIAFSGATLGLAVVSRPTDILIAAAAAAFILVRRRRSLPLFLVFAAIPAAAVTLYSALWLRNPLAFGQLYHAFGFGGRPWAMAGLLASPSRGLFVFSPVLLACLPGAWIAWKRKRNNPQYELLSWLAAGAAATILLFSFWGMWWGGASFGYRILVDVVPVLSILAAVGWGIGHRWPAGRRLAFGALFVFSVYVEVLGVFAYPTRFDEGLDLEVERLWDIRESELVFASRKLLGGGPGEARPEVAAVWWSLEKDDDTIPGWIDASPGGRVVRGALFVGGWAKSAAGDVEVAIAFDGGPVVTPERFARPDVASVLPELGDTSTTGWRATVAAPPGRLRERAMSVEWKDARGRVRRLGPIRFRWGPAIDTD
ncbi:MAG: glycosyltransferase family 39 protein [Acidobacteriota bacterium]